MSEKEFKMNGFVFAPTINIQVENSEEFEKLMKGLHELMNAIVVPNKVAMEQEKKWVP